MSYAFLKGHGTENDFVLLPDHDGSVHGDLPAERVRALCDRRAGIGGDGVLRVVRTSAAPLASSAVPDTSTPEWFMDYRNADGSLAEICGNGLRVFARHLYDEGLVPAGEPVRIATRAGVQTVSRDGDAYTVDVGLAEIHGETKVSVADRSWPATHVVVGNPHAVALVDDLAEAGSLADAAGVRRGPLPRRRQRRVRRPSRPGPHRDAGARAWLGRDPVVRHRRLRGGARDRRRRAAGPVAGRRPRRHPDRQSRRGGARVPTGPAVIVARGDDRPLSRADPIGGAPR